MTAILHRNLECQVHESRQIGSSQTGDSKSEHRHFKKQRHYFTTKVCLVKALVFPGIMYGCESLTIKKAEHQRIDAFSCGSGEDS